MPVFFLVVSGRDPRQIHFEVRCLRCPLLARCVVSQVDGFSSDTSVEFEDLMASRNLREMKEEVGRLRRYQRSATSV